MSLAAGRRRNKLPARLLIVTDRHLAARPLEALVADLMAHGPRWIWFRDKDMEPGARRALALALGRLIVDAGGWLTVGADIDLALEAGACGAHLSGPQAVEEARRRMGARALVGMSAHGPGDVAAAAAAGADYATLSPVFVTASKPGYGPALGPRGLHEAAAVLPVLALGGITLDNIERLAGTGVAGAAVMGEIMRARAPGLRAQALAARLDATLDGQAVPSAQN